MGNHSELRDALNALPQGPFEVCRGAAGAGCGCGLVWAVTGDRVVFVAEQERPDDLIPGYSREQAKVHGAALETILNALPGLLSDLEAAENALAEARETNSRLNRRCQLAESAANEKIQHYSNAGSLGRALANYAAAMYKRERDEARLDALRLSYEAFDYLEAPNMDDATLRRAMTIIANRPWRDDADTPAQEGKDD